jgi:RNA polymerase sigma-70 factor, ECF subfamily
MIMQVSPTRMSAGHGSAKESNSRCAQARRCRGREVQILTRLRTDERGVCEALFEQHHERMLSVARRLLRCEEDAADAVQNAFLAAIISLRRFRGRASISTWLHRIVVNECLMKLRSQKRRNTVSLDGISSTSMEGDTAVCEVAAECEHVLHQIDRAEKRLAVRRSIQQLPDAFREILILRDIEEFDTDQTAGLLGLSRSATKTRLHRARQALRAELDACEIAFA